VNPGESTTRTDTSRSRLLNEKARQFLPSGVTGDGRWSKPYPIAFQRGSGKWLVDVDGNRYLDYHGGFGTAILGYSHPEVDEAVRQAMTTVGTFVGVPHPLESELAERLCSAIPLAERVAFCGGGGSDAIYHAIRLARAATGRTKIVKMEGGYHGWHADVGVSVRPVLNDPEDVGLPEPVSHWPGNLPSVTSEVIVATVNDQAALRGLFTQRGEEIAAVIIEPALYSAGCIVVDKEYLQAARDLCTRHGAVLIFDEIMSGFRNGLGGAGARMGVIADLGAFGKAVANGHIMAVLAGKAELMRMLAPEGPVFYSGTYNGHPLSMAAALATLDVIERENVPQRIDQLGDRMAAGINSLAQELEVEAVCQAYGSIWNLYLNTTRVRNYRDLARSSGPETDRLNDEYLAHLRANGVYIHKRQVNRAFISAQHDEADVDRTVALVGEFLAEHREQLIQ
jgi:glutamate-1-semialdehyde 2,1-aminomutase